MLQGKKTYISLAVALLGILGLSHLVTEGELATTLDSFLQIIGIVGAIYGRAVAKPK